MTWSISDTYSESKIEKDKMLVRAKILSFEQAIDYHYKNISENEDDPKIMDTESKNLPIKKLETPEKMERSAEL